MIENPSVFPSMGEIMRVAISASRHLTSVGVPHALIGGAALAAHGMVRMTRDVDFLIGELGFRQLDSGILVFTREMPAGNHRVPVDCMPAYTGELNAIVDRAVIVCDVYVARLEDIREMKMASNRPRDKRDAGWIDEELGCLT